MMRLCRIRTDPTISRRRSRDEVIGERIVGDVVADDVQAEVLALQAAAVAELDFEIEHDALLRIAHLAARWLIATLPRISAPAMPIVSVNGSPSSIHAQATPNSGTR